MSESLSDLMGMEPKRPWKKPLLYVFLLENENIEFTI